MRDSGRLALLLMVSFTLAASVGCRSTARSLPEQVVATYIEKLRAQDPSRDDVVWQDSVSRLDSSPAVRLLADPSVDVFPPAYRSESPSYQVADEFDEFDEFASVTVVRGPAPSETTTAPNVSYEFALGSTKGGPWSIINVSELPDR